MSFKLPRQPSIENATFLVEQPCSTPRELDGKWVPARSYPHNAWPFWYRWGVAWKVLIGKYDALKWDA